MQQSAGNCKKVKTEGRVYTGANDCAEGDEGRVARSDSGWPVFRTANIKQFDRASKPNNPCPSPLNPRPSPVHPEGVEHTADSSGNRAVSVKGGADGGALRGIAGPLDPDLVMLIDRWPTLTADTKRRIVKLAGATASKE